MLAKALMGTVQSLDIGRMQLGQFLLELRYLQNTTCLRDRPLQECQSLNAAICTVSHLSLQFLDLLSVLC